MSRLHRDRQNPIAARSAWPSIYRKTNIILCYDKSMSFSIVGGVIRDTVLCCTAPTGHPPRVFCVRARGERVSLKLRWTYQKFVSIPPLSVQAGEGLLLIRCQQGLHMTTRTSRGGVGWRRRGGKAGWGTSCTWCPRKQVTAKRARSPSLVIASERVALLPKRLYKHIHHTSSVLDVHPWCQAPQILDNTGSSFRKLLFREAHYNQVIRTKCHDRVYATSLTMNIQSRTLTTAKGSNGSEGSR